MGVLKFFIEFYGEAKRSKDCKTAHTHTHTNYRRARQFDKMLTVFGMCEREKDTKTGLGKGEKRVWKEANQTT